MNRQAKNTPIRILLVDDSPYFVEAACDFLRLQPAFEVVGTASDGEEALAQARRLNPDVILLDLNLAQSSGLALIPAFKQEVACARVIVLTLMEGPSYRAAALQAGADDFVSKRDMSKELVRVIFAVAGRAANAPTGEQNPSQSAPQQEVSLERLAEHLPDLLYRYEFSPQCGFTYVSPSATAMTGYSPAEYYADPHLGLKLVHPDDRSLWENIVQGNFSPQAPVQLRWVRKDGSILWVEQRNVPIYDAEGNLIAIEGIARDVTEQRRTEEQLREAERFARSTLDSLSAHIAILDADGVILAVNRAWRQFAEMNGPLSGNVCEGANYLAVCDAAQGEDQFIAREFAAGIRRVLSGDAQEFAMEYPCHSPTEQRWFIGRVTRFVGEGPVRVVVAHENITARKQAEEALRESEDRYRDLVEHIHDLICIHDLEGNLLSVNRAATELLGYAKGEIVGRNLRDFLAPQVRHLVDAYLSEIQKRGAASGLMKVLTKSGEVRVWQYDNTLRTEGVEKPIVRGYARDVTEQRQAEKALRESEVRNRIIAEMISDYAYIFRVTPEGRLIGEWVTESFTKVFGYTLEEVVARGGWQSLVYPDDLPIALAHAQKVARGEEDVCEMRWVTARGEIRWLRDYAKPVFDKTGQRVVRIYGAAQDITEHKRAEAQIRRQLAELTALHAVAVVVNQSQSVDELIARVTQIVGDAFYGEHFGVLLFDEKKKVLRPHPSYRGLQNGHYPPEIPLNQGIAGRTAATCQPQRVGDVRRDPDYLVVDERMRSALCVPIQAGSRLIGVINVESPRLNHFTEADERLLVTIAEQLGNAIEKMRLAQAEQRRLLELEALYENSMAISGLLDADAIARAFMDTLEGRLRWHHAAVRLIEPNGEMRVIGVQSPHFKPGDTIPQKLYLQSRVSRVGQGMAGWVAQHGQSLRSGDLPSDPRYVETYPGIRSGLYVPLKVDGEIIGVVSVESEEPDAFTELDERLLNTLAAQTAVALQRSRLFAEAQRRLRRTQALREIDRSIARHAPLNETLQTILRHVTVELGVDAANILLFDPQEGVWKYAAGRGFRSFATQYTRLQPGEGFAGRAAAERRIVHVPDLSREGGALAEALARSREGFVAYFGVPLIAKDEVVGVLELFHRAPLDPDEEWLDFLEALAGQAAIAIDSATLYQNLQQANQQLIAAYDATIEGWARALDLRDEETEGHTRRVTELTLKLARQMGIPEEDLVHIRRGALLHDIGKMGIPDNILRKPGPLTEEEWRIMRRHPLYAYELLAPIAYLRPALDIPLYHHEKWDGTGYPYGLKGEQIPLAARIFAIADVWDALTNDRPYRKAWSREKALAYIREQSGRHFDPQVVERFLRVVTGAV